MKTPFFQRGNVPAQSVTSGVSKQQTPLELVLNYHEETKHHYHRFARSLGYLDWDNQPDPFRRYEGAPLFHLPLFLRAASVPSYQDVYRAGGIEPQPVNLSSISRLFRNSLAISAWKTYQDTRWALRVNPSSGNLHPTEGYAIIDADVPAGVYHYSPQQHAFEQRAKFAPGIFVELCGGFPTGSFFVGFTSIHWREAWKYGERAYRYCQHDLGHAMTAMRISAAVLGWQLVLLEELADEEIALLLGLNRDEDFHEAEAERPHCLAVVIPSSAPIPKEVTISETVVRRIADSDWHGRANRLSASHVEWEIIDEVAGACMKGRSQVIQGSVMLRANDFLPFHHTLSAEEIIQQRRSAVAMDGTTSLSREVFFSILSRVMPDSTRPPFDSLSRSELSTPRVHLALFVLRVDGLDGGIYMLVRDPAKLSLLQDCTHSQFLWKRPEGCPVDLPLYCLQLGEMSRIAASVSCGQDIAGDGAFSLGMIAEFEMPLKSIGAWLYPRLFWETGLIGQILYLEAEAAGVSATGMGCYFDDPMHELLGLQGKQFQSLYHFTVGRPLEDARIISEPPYKHI